MIGKLKGIIDSIAEDHLILDVGGVGYCVFAPRRTLSSAEVGTALSLVIETHVREDHIHLYGFASSQERDAFRLITTVQGVGVRMGLAILGQFTPDVLYTLIAAQDKKRLTEVSGVGPKLAERMITELKNKVGALALQGVAMPSSSAAIPAAKASKANKAQPANISEDAVSALVNLGYGRAEAFAATARAKAALGDDAGLNALIKAGLKELAG